MVYRTRITSASMPFAVSNSSKMDRLQLSRARYKSTGAMMILSGKSKSDFLKSLSTKTIRVVHFRKELDFSHQEASR